MVIRAGWNNTAAALLELGDVTVDDEIKTAVKRAASKAIKGDTASGVRGIETGELIEITDVQGVKSGQNYLMDIELAVPGSLSVEQINAIERAVRERAGSKVRGVRRVRVKFVSQDSKYGDLSSEFIGAEISPRSSPEPEDEHDHDHTHDQHGRKQQ